MEKTPDRARVPTLVRKKIGAMPLLERSRGLSPCFTTSRGEIKERSIE